MATEIMVEPYNGRLRGVTAADAEAIALLEGAAYRAVLTVPQGRSLSQLGLWFHICQMIAENSPGGWTKDEVDQTLRLACGHTNVRRDVRGVYYRTPKSIAFNKMDGPAFGALVDLMLGKAGELFGAGLAEAARAELDRIAAPDLSRAA